MSVDRVIDPVVVLDDDPTGTQAIADVPVALAWSDGEIGHALRPTDRAIHVLTNTRAFGPDAARAITADAARAALDAAPDGRIVLRGDSTLRGHVGEEYEGLRSVVDPGGAPPLLLVPALPSAGRITRGGVHLLVGDGGAVPLDETEYARDGAFAYGDARLLTWAEQRSGGLLRAADGIETTPDGVAAALAGAATAGRPAVVAPDAESLEDLETIAAGLRAAWADGVPALVRCAPAFAAVLAGSLADRLVDAPSDGGVLVVCGSFVRTTTAQIEALERRRPGIVTTISASALGGTESDAEQALAAAAAAATERLRTAGCAVVATSRERERSLVPVERQLLVAERFAELVGRVDPAPAVVVAKGGITSAVTATAGFHARTARVVGPLLVGVSLWTLDTGADYVVVPGNVGGPGLLAELLDRLAPAP